MTKRVKMSNRKFMVIWMPAAAFLVTIAIILQVAANLYAPILNTHLGRGERHVVVPEGTESWDTTYYDDTYKTATESKQNSLNTLLELTSEGIVLLKNKDDALPLSKSSKVTPFGTGSVYPIWTSGTGSVTVTSSYSVKYTDPSIGAIEPINALSTTFGSSNVLRYAMKLQPGVNEKGNATYDAGKGLLTNSANLGQWSYNGVSGVTYFGSGYWKQYVAEMPVGIYDNLGGTATVATTPEKKAAAEEEMKDSTALVFITRAGQEGQDRSTEAGDDGQSHHYLDITKSERDMIKKAKELCGKVVVLLNSSAPLEIDDIMSGELEADAILWIGHPGENGFVSVANILAGEVNPSGRLVDIYYKDFKADPTYFNFGSFTYDNAYQNAEKTRKAYYVEYSEGMYYGYRYYETAHDLNVSGFVYGKLDDEGGVVEQGQVNYPFGYGLSYTTYEKSITNFAVSQDTVTVKVNVKNTGKKAGKEAVEIYYSAPYTTLDEQDGVEKPTVNLIAFGKTDIIQPGKNQEITITFKKEDMTSYNYKHENSDGSNGCYFLEEGNYVISLRNNSHDVIETKTWNNPKTIWYDNTNARQLEKDMQTALDDDGNSLGYPAKGANEKWIAATNIFEYMTDYMYEESTVLSRKDWVAGVNAITKERVSHKEIAEKYSKNFIMEFGFDPTQENPLALLTGDNTDNDLPRLDSNPGSLVYSDTKPTSKADNGLGALDLRAKDYYDENWDLLLDQLDYEGDMTNILRILCGANYFTEEIESIALPGAEHCESANGVRIDSGEKYDANGNTSESMTASCAMPPLWAATRNVELIEKMGQALGYEALAVGKSGRYAPAFNLHRSPFAGRIFEYFSEDPILSGRMATAVVNGTSQMGMYDYIKHFGMNDQETNRASYIHTWATEQVQREIYNKPFEMVIRDARKTIKYTADNTGKVAYKTMRGCSAMMVAQNAYGYTMGFNNYDLVTRLVRQEWGFTGTINTDMFGTGGYQRDLMLRAGVDTWLTYGATSVTSLKDYDSATAQNLIREAIHHIAYTIVNSNVAQNAPPGSIIYYDMSPWQVALLGAAIPVYCIAGIMALWTVYRIIDDKRHPGKYQKPEKQID